jgi:undecaprenyl-diphosphatase
MNLIQALILGLVQGLTEYIPVSSSAHLVLVPWLLGWSEASFAFNVLVQWGTLVGVFVYFWRDLVEIIQHVIQGLIQRRPLATFEAKLGWLVVVATIPAVVLGLAFKKYIEAAFTSPLLAGELLFLTALILTAAEYFGRRTRTLPQLGWLDAVIIGLWQAVAMLPGVSRSGATIGGGMLRSIDRPAAARFSFLMSIPALLGAGVLALKDLMEAHTLAAELPVLTIGFIAAGVSGYLCIRWLLGYLQCHSLYVFAIYCAAASLVTVLVAYGRG